MDCPSFRRRYPEYTKMPLPREVCETPLHEEWCEHLNDCGACTDWYMGAEALRRGLNPAEHPCNHIAYFCSQESGSDLDPLDDVDVTLWTSSGKYGIPVRDGGSSIIEIAYCPWCGVKLSD